MILQNGRRFIDEYMTSLEEKQRQARSALLKKQTAEGTRGGPLGDSEVEEQDDDFKAALDQALSLCRAPEARYLPGWCGAE